MLTRLLARTVWLSSALLQLMAVVSVNKHGAHLRNNRGPTVMVSAFRLVVTIIGSEFTEERN